MTKSETIAQLETLRNYLIGEDPYGAQDNDIAALNTVIEAAHSDKVYTALDVIRLVQEAVSEEICGLGDEGMVVAYEVERGIIEKLVKEDGCETNV